MMPGAYCASRAETACRGTGFGSQPGRTKLHLVACAGASVALGSSSASGDTFHATMTINGPSLVHNFGFPEQQTSRSQPRFRSDRKILSQVRGPVAYVRTVFAVYEVACVTQPRLFLRCYEPRI